MKKNSFLAFFWVIGIALFFSQAIALSDEASDMMDAALAQQAAVQQKKIEGESLTAAKNKSAVETPDVSSEKEKKSNLSIDHGKEVSGKVASEESASSAPTTEDPQLVIADFDSGDKPNNLGGDFGAWDKDPNDDSQGCAMSFISDDPQGNPDGFALRLDYDVDSPTPAYNGLYVKLENTNATSFDVLSFYVHGASNRFTKQFKVELKTADHRSSFYIVSGITEKWQEIQIPLKWFKGIKKEALLSELIFVFDDVNSSPKKGTLIFDQINLKRTKRL